MPFQNVFHISQDMYSDPGAKIIDAVELVVALCRQLHLLALHHSYMFVEDIDSSMQLATHVRKQQLFKTILTFVCESLSMSDRETRI